MNETQPTAPKTIAEFETRSGPILALRNDRPISESLEKYGEWAQIEIEFLCQFIADDSVILDAGSHIGIHSLAFAHSDAKNVHVHAFEAQPQLAALLMRNAEVSGGRISVHQCAIGQSEGVGFMPRLPDDRLVNAGAQSLDYQAGPDKFEVPIRSIDSFVLSGVKLIKLDIEGCEAAALRGAVWTVSNDKPVIYCEVNSIAAAADLFRVTEDSDYRCYYVSTPAFNPRNFRSTSVNFFGPAHESGLLFLPSDYSSFNEPEGGTCTQVRNLDEFAQLFLKTPRYGDRTDRDRDCIWLKEETEILSKKISAYRNEIAQRDQSLVAALAKAEALDEKMRVEKRRYDVLALLLSNSDRAARRRSAIGTVARRLGRSELARVCRVVAGSGLFDRKWYKRAYPDVAASKHEPIVHYLLFGAFEGRKPNPLFDSAYYLSQNPDVRSSGINPLLHYIQWGEREMRRPSADFDPASYLRLHPSLTNARTLLLKHFLDSGSVIKPVVPQWRPAAPDWSAFEALAVERKTSANGSALVDVIIPVYRGYADTLACIHSVLTSENKTPYELVVIDDASPEPDLSDALDRLARMGLISLLRNERNLGFVGTVNRGMALHPDRDVLLLNSDTLVFNDWVDRVRAHAGPDVASITPFTNNGTICSYPEFCRDNPGKLEVSFSELDLIAARVNRDRSVEVPTGVGFCMYITRRALDVIGLFDIETFGRGYGEENDFCVRAFEQGMRNVHALDVFVFHSGETSFGADASQAKKAGLKALIAKHPGYIARVEKYIGVDPARKARQRLDAARLLKGDQQRIILCFTHLMGGGIERYIKDRAELNRDAGEAFLMAVPGSPDGNRIRLSCIGERPVLPNLPDFDMDGDGDAFVQFLRSLPIDAIEIHSTVGWSAEILQSIPMISRSLGIPFDFTVHDYVPVCPRINLIDESGVYCGEEGEEQCRRCLRAGAKTQNVIHPDAASCGMTDIVEWRAQYERFLAQAREVAAPSSDTATRLRKYFPDISVMVRPHEEPAASYIRPVAKPYRGGTLNVVIIGAIGSHKGSEILRDCADDAARRSLPIHFTVVGYTNIPELASRPNVTVTGPYAEHEVYDRIEEAGAHIALLPSVWPETYCYTLSIAISSKLPVCVFEMGAPAARLRQAGNGTLIPLSKMSDASAINDILLNAVPAFAAE